MKTNSGGVEAEGVFLDRRLGETRTATLTEVKAGEVILARRSRGETRTAKVEEWVCLACEPGWAEVHLAALQAYAMQLGKEEALLKSDFASAAACLKSERHLEERLNELIQRIRGSDPRASVEL